MADAALPEDLAALVGSRICHDLVNPLGAIGNGAELLVMEDSRLGPLARLIGDSVESATARLRLYRLAFGPPGAERIGQPEIAATVAGYVAGRRLSVGWEAPGDRARADVRLAFLLILCAETALPRGGEIAVTGDALRL
ncbi:MAG: histidine phosphotransferase family protein, partial [Gemmobacter sp.]